MDKLDQLFIRACKSQNPAIRVDSVYRRFYAVKPQPVYICGILVTICTKYLTIDLADFIDALSPENAWKYEIEVLKTSEFNDSYYKKIVKILISKIRLSKVKIFPGLVLTRMFRKDKGDLENDS